MAQQMRYETSLQKYREDNCDYKIPNRDIKEVIKLIRLIKVFREATLNLNEFDISFNSISPSETLSTSDKLIICKVKYKHLHFADIISNNIDSTEVTINYSQFILAIINTINPSLEIIDEKIELKNNFELFESSIDHLEDVRRLIANFWV